jgi:hypothetical protein
MSVQPDLEFIKALKKNRRGYPEEVLSMRFLFHCLPLVFRPAPFSEEGNDLVTMGNERKLVR